MSEDERDAIFAMIEDDKLLEAVAAAIASTYGFRTWKAYVAEARAALAAVRAYDANVPRCARCGALPNTACLWDGECLSDQLVREAVKSPCP